jgi:protein TonB
MITATRNFDYPRYRTGFLCIGIAVAIHAALLFLISIPLKNPPLLIEADATSIEVSLVALAEPAAEETISSSPNDTPLLEAPLIDEPIETPEAASIAMPEPTPVATPAPTQHPVRKNLKPLPKKNTQTAQTTANTANAGIEGRSGTSNGEPKTAGKPAFIVRPRAPYPPESRAAGEQGVVILRITVNAQGRPTDVRVVGSSGYPRLDRAAIEGGWRCRIRNAVAGSQLDAPVRFNLNQTAN